MIANEEIRNFLVKNSEEKYRDFNKKLMPDTTYEVLGVRTPVVKKLAAEIVRDKDASAAFLSSEHRFYEEWLLHGLVIANEKENVSDVFTNLRLFMPRINTWAICDGVVAALKIFKKHKTEAMGFVKELLTSEKTYSIRFAVVILLDYFIEKDYLKEIVAITLPIKSGEYYIDMAVAWLYSVMLVKEYDFTVKIIEEKRLPRFTHNKAIQKAIESFRISEDKKEYLKTLKIK